MKKTTRVLIFIAVLSPVLAIASFSYFKTRQELTESALDRRQALARLSAALLQEKLDSLIHIGVSLASRVQFRMLIEEGRWEEAMQILQSVSRDFPFVERIFLSDPKGTLKADIPHLPDVIGENFSHRDWYQGTSREWKPYISEVYQRTAKPRYNVIAAAVPIRTQSQEPVGILVLQVRLDMLLEWSREIEVGPGGFIYFVDKNGHLAAHPYHPPQGAIVDFSSAPVVKRVLSQARGIGIFYNPIEEEERLSAYEPIPGYGWGVIVQQPTREAFALRDEKLKFDLAVYAVIFFLNALLGGFVVSLLQRMYVLRQREKIFLDCIGDGVFAIDRHGRIILWNRAAAELTGWSQAEVFGQHFREFIKFIRESDGSDVSGFIDQAMESGKVKYLEDDVALANKDGREIPVGDSAAPVFDPEGKVVGGIVVFRDVTDQKLSREAMARANVALEDQVREKTGDLRRTSEALKSAQEKLAQQEKLRALGEMASGIAHDFNNALAPILGYSELILEEADILEDKEKRLEYLRILNTAAKDAANVVKRLREFYRPRERHETFNPLNLNAVVEAAVQLTQPKWKTQALSQGLDISVKTDLAEIPPVPGNEAELREAVINLIFNAVDAMPRGGVIYLKTYLQDKDVVVEVGDTGTGMTDDVRRRCLEPFFTTKHNEGTGLGLSLVYGIIRRHGGLMDIQSELGKGTTFTLIFPLGQTSPGPEAEKIPVVSAEKPGSIRPLKILYVEDEENVRNVMQEFLTRDGHTVAIASTGLEGLNQFHAGRFDLVITDRAMPEMDGLKLARAVKKIAPGKPVILLSGTGLTLSDNDSALEGVDLMLHKPVTWEALRKAISDLMAGVLKQP